MSEVPEYIDSLLSVVRRLHSRIFRAEENVDALLRTIYSTWALLPVLRRKDLKEESPLALNEREERFQKRYAQIEDAANELNRILSENYKLLFDLLPHSVYDRDEYELDGSNSYNHFCRAPEDDHRASRHDASAPA